MKYLAHAMMLAALSVVCGCAHEYIMPSDPMVLGDETVSIETLDGQWHNARAVTTQLGPAWDAGEDALIPPLAVKTVVKSNVGRHIGIGAAIGAVGGFLTGALIGLSAGDDHCVQTDDNLCLFVLSATDKALLLGLVLHPVGALVGLGIGGASAENSVYVRPQVGYRLSPPHVSLVPLRGGAAGALAWTF